MPLILRRKQGRVVEIRHRSGDVIVIRVNEVRRHSGEVCLAFVDPHRHFEISRPDDFGDDSDERRVSATDPRQP